MVSRVMGDADRQGAPAAIDIKALLSVALEQRPRDDVQERVMSRVAAVTTAMEFARLIFVAPFQWIVDEHLRGDADAAEGDGDAEG